MLQHIFKLIWNRKAKNSLLLVELIISFFLLFGIFTFIIFNAKNYVKPIGWAPENRWIAHLSFKEIQEDTSQVIQMKTLIKQEVLALPEVISCSFKNASNMNGNSNWATGNDDNGFYFNTYYAEVDEDFQKTMDIELLEGRWFNEDDLNAKYTPIIISDRVKEEYMAERKILDSILIIQEECKVVGIMKNINNRGRFSEGNPFSLFYKDHKSYSNRGSLTMHLKDDIDPLFEERLFKTISEILKKEDFRIEHIEETLTRNARTTWIPIIAMSAISLFLLINIALGLIGVLYNDISKRRGEIGIRKSMGASNGEIVLQFVGEILLITLAALFIGFFFAVQIPFFKLLPFEFDYINCYQAICASILLILFIVGLAAFYPSWSASRMLPAEVLRDE